MYPSLFILLFWCIYLSSILESNQIYALEHRTTNYLPYNGQSNYLSNSSYLSSNHHVTDPSLKKGKSLLKNYSPDHSSYSNELSNRFVDQFLNVFISFKSIISNLFTRSRSATSDKPTNQTNQINQTNQTNKTNWNNQTDQSNQTISDQLNLISLVSKSNKFNLEHLAPVNGRLNHKSTNRLSDLFNISSKVSSSNLNHSSYISSNITSDRSSTKSIDESTIEKRSKFKLNSTRLEKTFYRTYKSNYAHFCACPPKLANAYHSLQDRTHDSEDTECIYLPLTIVEYECNKNAKRLNDQIVINRLVCDLNQETHRLDWIMSADERLVDLDERLVYSDQFTDQQNEIIEIKSQSIHLSDFNVIEFLQCECKLILTED